MLVCGIYRFRTGVDQRAGLKRFQARKPPADFSFQAHWATADGMGGMFIAETTRAAPPTSMLMPTTMAIDGALSQPDQTVAGVTKRPFQGRVTGLLAESGRT